MTNVSVATALLVRTLLCTCIKDMVSTRICYVAVCDGYGGLWCGRMFTMCKPASVRQDAVTKVEELNEMNTLWEGDQQSQASPPSQSC